MYPPYLSAPLSSSSLSVAAESIIYKGYYIYKEKGINIYFFNLFVFERHRKASVYTRIMHPIILNWIFFADPRDGVQGADRVTFAFLYQLEFSTVEM